MSQSEEIELAIEFAKEYFDEAFISTEEELLEAAEQLTGIIMKQTN